MKKLSLVLLLTLLVGCDKTSTEQPVESLLKAANIYVQAKKYEKAKEKYKEIIERDSQSSEAYLGLAKVAEIENNRVAILNNLLKVIEINPSDKETYARVVNLYLSSNDFLKAKNISEKLLEVYPDNAESYALLAVVYFKAGEQEKGYEFAQKALSIDQTNYDAIVLVSSYLYDKKDYDGAIDLLDKGLIQHQENIKLNQYKAQSLRALGKVDEANSIYQSIINEHSDYIPVYFDFAQFYIDQNKKDEAIVLLEKLDTSVGINARDRAKIVQFYNNNGFAGQALVLLKKYKALYADEFFYSLLLADQYAILSDFDLSKKEYLAVINQYQTDESSLSGEDRVLYVSSLVGLAKLGFRQKDFEQSKSNLDKALSLYPRHPEALLLRATLFLTIADYKSAITDLRLLLTINKKNIIAQKMLADAYLDSDQSKEAFFIYEDLIKNEPDNKKIMVNYVYRLIATNDYRTAYDRANSWLVKYPNDLEMLKLYAEANVGLANYNKLLTVMDRIISIEPGSAFGFYGKGIAYSGLGERSTAIKFFKESLSVDSSDVKVAIKLLSEYQRDNKIEAAVKYYEKMLLDGKRGMGVYFALGKAYELQKVFNKAKNQYQEMINRAPDNPLGYQSMAVVNMRVGDYDQAIMILQSGLSKVSASPLYYELGNAYFKKQDYNNAMNAYAKAFSLDKKDLYSINNYISLMSDHHTDISQLESLEKIVKSLEKLEKPFLYDTLGWFYYRMKDYYQAELFLEKAVNQNPDEPLSLYHLGMVYKAQGRLSDAREILQKSISLAKEDFVGLNEAKETLKSLQGQ